MLVGAAQRAGGPTNPPRPGGRVKVPGEQCKGVDMLLVHAQRLLITETCVLGGDGMPAVGERNTQGHPKASRFNSETLTGRPLPTRPWARAGIEKSARQSPCPEGGHQAGDLQMSSQDRTWEVFQEECAEDSQTDGNRAGG